MYYLIRWTRWQRWPPSRRLGRVCDIIYFIRATGGTSQQGQMPATFEWSRESTQAIRDALAGKQHPYDIATVNVLFKIAQRQEAHSEEPSWRLQDDWVPLKVIEAVADRLGLPHRTDDLPDGRVRCLTDVYDVALLHKKKPQPEPGSGRPGSGGSQDGQRPRSSSRASPKPSPRGPTGAESEEAPEQALGSSSKGARRPPSAAATPRGAGSSRPSSSHRTTRPLPTLRHEVPQWWRPPGLEQVIHAADAYDKRHHNRSSTAEGVLQAS